MSRELAARLQRLLQGFYRVENTPCVSGFLRAAEPGQREQLLVREQDGALDIAVVLPVLATPGKPSFDEFGQLVEGVSHFIYLARRALADRSTSQLELELQAEVDKFVALADHLGCPLPGRRGRRLVHDLYGKVRYLHPAGTSAGDRYRLANRRAAAFVIHSLRAPDPAGRFREFYRAGLEGKLRLASAA